MGDSYTSWDDVFQGLTFGLGGALINRLNAPAVPPAGAAAGNAAAAPSTTGKSGLNTQAKLAQLVSNPLAWVVLLISGFAVYKLTRG